MSKRYSLHLARGGPKGDVRTTPRKPDILDGISQAGNHGQAPDDVLPADLEPDPPIAQAMSILLSYTEGWLRFTPDTEHKTLFLKFKFKRGTYAGRYVMAVVQPHELQRGLSLLLDKVRAVYEKRLTATVDTPYD
jgi:hypothetical protein